MDLDDDSEPCGPVIAAGRARTPEAALVTAAEAERRYGVKASRVYVWRHRNLVTPRGYRGRHPVYLAHELRTLNRLADLDPRSGPGKRRTALDA